GPPPLPGDHGPAAPRGGPGEGKEGLGLEGRGRRGEPGAHPRAPGPLHRLRRRPLRPEPGERQPGVAGPPSLPAALGTAPCGRDRARGLPREGRDRLRREDGPAGREPPDHRAHRDAAPPSRWPALPRPERPVRGRPRAGRLRLDSRPMPPPGPRVTTLAPPLNYRLLGSADIR